MRKWLLIFSPLIAFILILTVGYVLFFPTLEKKVLSELQNFSKKLPVNIEAESFALTLFPPGGILTQVSVKPKDTSLPEVKLSRVSAYIDIISVITGRFRISDVIADQVYSKWNMDEFLSKPSTDPDIDLKKIFEMVNSIPLSRMRVTNSQFHIRSDKKNISSESHIKQLVIAQRNKFIRTQIYLDKGIYQFGKSKVEAETILDLGLSPEEFNIAKFYVNSLDPKSTFYGKIQIAGSGKIKEQSGEFQLRSENFEFPPFRIGDVDLRGQFNDQQLSFGEFLLKNAAGDIELKNFKLSIPSFKPLNLSVSSELKTANLDLHQLMQTIGVGTIPVWLETAGRFKCDGPVYPEPQIECNGELDAKKFRVASSMNAGSDIVRIQKLGAQGSVKVDSSKVSYSTSLTLPKSKGESSGEISYAEGFKIKYSSPAFDFSDVEHLSGLKLSGVVDLEGSTKGYSSAATFGMGASGKNVFFEDFNLGNLKTELNYVKGHLYLEDIVGKIESSEYQGSVDVDIGRERVAIDGLINPLDLNDFAKIVAGRFKMPIAMTGRGQAQFFMTTPFNIRKLSIEGAMSANNGSIANEAFESAEVTVIAKNGNIDFRNFVIKRLNGDMKSTGSLDLLANTFNLDIVGNSLRLEDSDNVNRISSNVTGILNFISQLRGPLNQPDFQMKSEISNLVVEDQEFPTSHIDLEVNKNLIASKGQLFGRQLIFDFQMPFENQAPFYVKLNANQWNFTTLFGLIGAGNLLREFDSEVTGTLDLKAGNGKPQFSTGTGVFEKFVIKRGAMVMSNPKPMNLQMNDGSITLSGFRLQNQSNFVEASGENFSTDNLNMRVISDLDLRFVQIITPFLDELTGKLKLNVNLRGKINSPEVFGNAQVQNTFARFKGFPHALERISTQVNFSQSRITFNDILGSFGGGLLKGEGFVELRGPSDIPTRVTAQITNANLNFPDKMRTNGDIDVLFSGNWFPFTLSGTYVVKTGLIEKEFGGGSLTGTLKQSSYLPKVILQKSFEPITLDLQINLDNYVQIKNSMVNGRVAGQLQIKGPLSAPGILGKLSTDKNSQLYFRDKVFDINNANIAFQDLNQINPNLYVSARSRVKEYDVSLLVQGTAEQPAIRVTSVPPLSESDIISLLALGVTSQQLSQTDSRSQEENLNSEIATAAAAGLFSKPIRDSFGLDLQVSSQYDDTKNIAVQKATLSKQVSDRLKASVSQSRGGDQSSNELKLQYSINPNVSAIGSLESRQGTEQQTTTTETQIQSNTESIFGLDLEFKREFK